MTVPALPSTARSAITTSRVAVRADAAGTPPSADAACALSLECHSCSNQRGCGWCPSTGTCRYGSWLGPAIGTCSNWVWAGVTCTIDVDQRGINPAIGDIIESPISNAVTRMRPAVDPSDDLKQFDLTIDEVLKADAEGNLFKSDPIGAALKEDPAGNGLKEWHMDTSAAPRPTTLNRVSTSTKVVTVADADGDLMLTSFPTSVDFIDMYDPDPFNSAVPHGHFEPHIMTAEVEGGVDLSKATNTIQTNMWNAILLGHKRRHMTRDIPCQLHESKTHPHPIVLSLLFSCVVLSLLACAYAAVM